MEGALSGLRNVPGRGPLSRMSLVCSDYVKVWGGIQMLIEIICKKCFLFKYNIENAKH